MKVYAFDVDETLEVSSGPVRIQDLIDLRNAGHIVGLCGNWAVAVQTIQNWQYLFSFMNIAAGKDVFLAELKRYVAAEDYIMVGNDPAIFGASNDKGAAERAGWRFLRETEFAGGQR